MHAKLRSALTRLGGADAIVMQSTVGKELAQGPYVAARAGFEPATLRTNLPMSHYAPQIDRHF